MYTVIGIVLAGIAVALHYYWPILWGIIRLLTIMVKQKSHYSKVKKGYFSFADEIEKKVDANPDNVQFIMAETGEKRTLKELDLLANQIAHWASSKGCKQSHSAALMLLNTVDYVAIWYGLSKIGMSTALLNTNVTGKAFLHSVETALKSSDVKVLIVDSQLKDTVKEEIKELISKGFQVHVWGEQTLANEIQTQPSERPSKSLRKDVIENDPVIFIFTSGTTGLPKACKISHSRYWLGSIVYPVLAELSSKDVIYSAMPLYHSAAGLLAAGAALSSGATLVTRKKFSATNFTKECLEYGVTSVQYIGELCRYLVNLPPNPLDDQLKIRSAFGNGMRIEYWSKFQARYHVKHIIEFYSATEGNVGLFNVFDKVGPLGFVPRVLDFVYPLHLVKTDPADQSVPYRNEKGFCENTDVDEPGLLLSKIAPDRRFEGYTDQNATNAKILRDVFKKGDAYFNTGDLLSRDAVGFYYWSDRIGDTFRWKGENVSTTEVSQVLSECETIEDIVVYGVAVPNTDGKAGMAAIVSKGDKLDLEEIQAQGSKNLPAYARPLFLRLKADRKLPTTSTHKYIKSGLVKEVRAFVIRSSSKDLIVLS